MSTLTSLTLQAASELIKLGELSPVELTEAYLERIERLDPDLNCYITVIGEQALHSAHQAEAEIHQGKYRGPLHGIPLGLKDLYETQGVRTTGGSKFFENHKPESDSAVTQALHAAGSVLLGKHNMHEIALGVTNVNPHYGPCRNPWDRDRVSGGSSGGSAAAVAAGLCLGAMGTDTGGSIRIPSALCGVVGLKPTYGRVSKRGVMPLSWSLDHAGPLARTVRDVALIFSVVAGYDPLDPHSVRQPKDDYLANLDSGVHGWRIALADDPFFQDANMSTLNAVQHAAAIFEALGATVLRVKPPEARLAARANALICVSEAATFHRQRLESCPEAFGADILNRLTTGAAVHPDEYILARQTQVNLRREWERFFEQFDLLITPTTPVAAPAIEGPDAVEQARLLTRFTAPFNLTGFPALSLPCGRNGSGLPIGLQLVAPHWAEARLLQAGNAYEAAAQCTWTQDLLAS